MQLTGIGGAGSGCGKGKEHKDLSCFVFHEIFTFLALKSSLGTVLSALKLIKKDYAALFKKATKKSKAQEAPEPKLVSFKDGEVLVQQGMPPKIAYIIKSGHVSVVSKSAAGSKQIATLGKGQIVGEMSLLKGFKATANVIAQGDVVAQPITTTYINKELAKMNSVMRLILLSLVERLYRETFIDK
jgi:signal-transduction protein with cAMP-binding, CBS, and nucleotidyltransferase domain